MVSSQINAQFEIGKLNTGTGVFTPMITNDSSRLGYVAPASRNNPQEQDTPVRFLEGGLAIDEKEILVVKAKPGAAVTAESEESKFFMEVTIVDKATKKERTSAVTFDTMTGFKSADAVDIALRAGVNNDISEFEIPSNQQYILGRRDGQGKVYLYLGDNQ